MDNNRLEQTTGHGDQTADLRGFTRNRDWKKHHEREEELRQVSPRLARLEEARSPEVSPGQWKEFSRKLDAALAESKQGMGQTIRDRIRASDHNLVRWFWIVIALLVLALGALAIASSLHVLPIKPKGLDVVSTVSQHDSPHIQV